MPRPSIGDTPMTGAERQARYRAMHANGEGRSSSSISLSFKRSNHRATLAVIEQRDGPAGLGHDDAWKGSRFQTATD